MILYQNNLTLPAIRLNPDSADIYYNLSNAHMLLGDVKNAILAYKKALDINSNDADITLNLAIAYYHAGEHKLAISYGDKAVKLGAKVHPEFLEIIEALKSVKQEN